MSVADQLKNLFAKKAPDSELESRFNLGTPGVTTDSVATEQMRARTGPESVIPIIADKPAQSADEGRSAETAQTVEIPLLGKKTVDQHQRLFLLMLGIALVSLALVAAYTRFDANKVGQQLSTAGQALTQSERLAKSVSQSLVGNAQAFQDVAQSSDFLARSVRGLQAGNEEIDVAALSADYKPELDKITPLMEKAEKNAAIVLAQQKTLTQVAAALRLINKQSSALLEIAETVASLKLNQNAPAAEISAAGQLVMLTQRIGKSSNEFLTVEGVSAELVFLLGKDLNSFKEIAQGLLDGSPELRLAAARDLQTREQLTSLIKLFEASRTQAGVVLGNLQGLFLAREAQVSIVAGSEPLRQNLEALQAKLAPHAGLSVLSLVLLVGSAMFAMVCAGGLSYAQLLDSRKRQVVSESQQLSAELQKQEAKRVNDANQAAILRLMNELQTVAEGDLTHEATVTEDITGAIADSVNYTVEELRQLVGNVQSTATRVAQTTALVESTSTELLAASTEQLREIRETGQSVLDMASRINEVSGQAQESSQVARQSLSAAESGLQAVQNAIGGMNSIRDQIQETSKRIKRLGESSQEIGEITELISDITEQTNVLALNAAIQAASAGEAGRGFSVVAEEVQRLAERSADATRQISALVKAIQTDTQDAVAAMERSTQGVVEGAKLSDNAGTALSEIDRVSRRLADLIEQISASATREAESANVLAGNIQHIFAVTEQTGEGTRSTAQQVRDLSRFTEELRQSVSRFKIA